MERSFLETREELRVKHSGYVELAAHDGGERGFLAVGEGEKNIPFPLKRFFFISNLEKSGNRGGHAHKKTDQVIFCLKGAFDLDLDDGEQKQKVHLPAGATGVRLEPWLWHEMSNFSPDCVILVIADQHYDETDYVRNYEDFQKTRPN